MAVKSRARTLPHTYFDLVKEFPLTHIRDDAHLEAASALIDRLLRKDLDRGEQDYLDVLTDLVEKYEDEHVDIPAASEADVLRELMAANRLTQPRLAEQVAISQSTVSALLNGTRELTKAQVITLARFFNISPLAFMPSA